MTSNENYQVMKESQIFFQDAIHTIMDGNLTKLKELIKQFQSSHSNVTTKEIFEEFQSEGRTLLHVAASSGKSNIVEYIVNECLSFSTTNNQEFINKVDKNGMTPLLHATVAESIESMKILISHGANVNLVNKDMAGCVHFASSDGSVERLNLLVHAGADLLISSGAGTPLHWAAGKGRSKVVKYLIEKGVDVNCHNSNGLPAIIMAAVAHDDESVCELLNANANFDHILSGQLSLLHLCAENGLSRAVIKIMQSSLGQTLNNMKTVDENYPIHLAAMSKHRNIVEYLLPFSIDQVISSNIDDIMKNGEIRMVRWNQKNGNDNNSNDNNSNDTSNNSNSHSYNSNDTSFHNSREIESTDPPKSIEDIKKADEYKQKGNEFYIQKKYNEAIEEYSNAIKLHGNSAPLWSNRSACYLAIKDYQNALLDAETCRRLDPQWAKGCYRLATARLALELYEDAAVAAFEGCKLDESNKELKNLLKEAVRLGQEEYKKKTKS